MIFFILIFSIFLFSYEPEELEKTFETAVMAPLASTQSKFDYSQDNILLEKSLCLIHAHILNETESDPWRMLYTLWYTDLRIKYHITTKLSSLPNVDIFQKLDRTLDEFTKKTLRQKTISVDEIIYYINAQDKSFLFSFDTRTKNLYNHFLLWSLIEQQSVCNRYKNCYIQKLLVLLHQMPQHLLSVPSIKNYVDFGFHCATKSSDEESSSWYATTDSD